MIQVNNVEFSYGPLKVLDHISMNIHEGRIYGLLGENGVGKTTLLTLLSGLKKPKSGTITIDGKDPYQRRPEVLGSIYYLPDETTPLFVSGTKFARTTGQFWPDFDYHLFCTIMQEFETDPEQKMSTMSAGQLKKTHIAFALACRTKYLFMDEPTNGLDIPSKAQFRKALMVHTPEETCILISTHQVKDLENVIDPIIILDKQDVLLHASLAKIADKLYFDYSNQVRDISLYSEQLPGGFIQVVPNTTGEESKVNIEALFNAVHRNKELIKNLFKD